MGLREVVLKFGTSLAAGVITYLVANGVAPDASGRTKLVICLVVASLALALAVASQIGKTKEPQSGVTRTTQVGTGIRAKKDVNVKDIVVESDLQRDSEIGTRISSGGSVEVSGVTVRGTGEPHDKA